MEGNSMSGCVLHHPWMFYCTTVTQSHRKWESDRYQMTRKMSGRICTHDLSVTSRSPLSSYPEYMHRWETIQPYSNRRSLPLVDPLGGGGECRGSMGHAWEHGQHVGWHTSNDQNRSKIDKEDKTKELLVWQIYFKLIDA